MKGWYCIYILSDNDSRNIYDKPFFSETIPYNSIISQ